MMHVEVNEAIDRRRALRVLDPSPLTGSEVDRLVHAMSRAPSCFNSQPWQVVLIQGDTLPAAREALTRGNAYALNAPLLIAICAKPADDCRLSDGRDYYQFDCGLAAMQMMLQATEMGIIAHPIAGYRPDVMREALSIPKDYVIVVVMVCGRPGGDNDILEGRLEGEGAPSQRDEVGEHFHRDRWGTPF